MKTSVKYNIVFFLTLIFHNISLVFAHDQQNGQLPNFCQHLSSSSPHCGITPTSHFDDRGTLWTVYVDGEHVKLVTSKDNGETFSPAVTINSNPEVISADGENRPKIGASNNNEIYISWSRKTKGQYSADIRFSRSLDGGKTFSAPITINDDGLQTSHRYDSLLVMENGDVYLVWLDKRDIVAAKKEKRPYNGSAIYYTVSNDSGATFKPNKKIADHTCECCRVITDEDSAGNPVVLWRHIFGDNIRDHAITALDVNTEIQRVTFDDWQINACPHHGPDMLTENNAIHQVWFTGKAGQGGLHYGKYDREKNQLSNRFQIDTSPLASRPQIALFNERLYIIWKRVEDEQTVLNLISSRLNDIQWSKPEVIATTDQSSDHPQLVQNQQQLLATWWSEDKGMQIIDIADSRDAIRLSAFDKSSFEAIQQTHQGQDFLFVLWSLDCPPCFKELELLEQYSKAGNLPKLILVSTNGRHDSVEITKILEQFSINTADHWYFDGIDEQLRYSIDPSWYGELPRSYFFKQNGTREVHRGLLTEETLKLWLESISQS